MCQRQYETCPYIFNVHCLIFTDLVMIVDCLNPPSSCAPLKYIVAECKDSNYTIYSGSLLYFLWCDRDIYGRFSHSGRSVSLSNTFLNINGSFIVSGIYDKVSTAALEMHLTIASVAISSNLIIQKGISRVAFVLSRP